MLRGIVSGAEKDIIRIPMQVGEAYEEGWEVRDNQGRLIWGREDELQTATGTLPFKGYGVPLKVKGLLGNLQQSGTPTPDTPITPDSVGTLSGSDWIIPFACAGQTTSVYLGQVSTVRRIKKRVFDGSENWTLWNYLTAVMFYTPVADGTGDQVMSSHFGTRKTGSLPIAGNVAYNGNSNKNMIFRMFDDTTTTTVDSFKAWLAAQYANGTPVTVWYILAEPTTGIVNEPLRKIGDYADELTSAIATLPEIPTTTGSNTLTVGTAAAPSSLTVKGHAKRTNI